MIYAFLTDEALYNRVKEESSAITDTVANSGVGYLSDKMINYFEEPTSLFSIGPRIQPTGLLYTPKGDMRLHFDKNKVDTDQWNALAGDIYEAGDNDITDLFNIISYMALSQGVTESDMDTHMQGDSTNYGNYVAGSCLASNGGGISTTTTEVTVLSDNIPDPSSMENIPVRDWISFKWVPLATGETIHFKIWLKGAAFLTDYPYSVIMDVIFPCDPANFLSMSTLNNIVEAVVESGVYMSNLIAPKLQDEDYSGFYVYRTLYDNDTYTTDYEMPFGVLYKGQPPSTIAARTAIRDALLATEDGLGNPLATEEQWKNLFPNLFVDNEWYIVPMWYNTQDIPGYTLHRSVINYDTMKDVMEYIYPDYETTVGVPIEDRMEVLNSDSTEMFLVAIPGPDNEDKTSLVVEHPTYIAVDAVEENPQFNYMEEHTKDFATKLCQTLGVLFGGVNTFGLQNNTLSMCSSVDYDYLSFTASDYVEYHVLKPGSFPSGF